LGRYFFDIHDGQRLVRDPEGHECDSPEAIRHEAMHALPHIAKEVIPRTAKDSQAFTVLVRDQNNAAVYTATVTFAGLWMGDAPIPGPDDDRID
jgi:hypothetical protein